MPVTRRSDAFAFGARTVPFFAAIVACAVTARVEAQPTGSQIVNTNGSSLSGWTFSNTSQNGGQNGSFTGSAGSLGGTWWGLYANTGQTADQTYNFFADLQNRGQTALRPGDIVQIDISLGFVNSGGSVGISLQNSAGTKRFETYYIGGHASNSFKLNDAGGEENITGPNTSFEVSSWSNNQFQTIVYTQLADNAYNLTFDGTLITNSNRTIAASDITQVRFFNFNAGSGADHNQYTNNLVVVPEPSAILTAIGGLAGLGVYRSRRRR